MILNLSYQDLTVLDFGDLPQDSARHHIVALLEGAQHGLVFLLFFLLGADHQEIDDCEYEDKRREAEQKAGPLIPAPAAGPGHRVGGRWGHEKFDDGVHVSRLLQEKGARQGATRLVAKGPGLVKQTHS